MISDRLQKARDYEANTHISLRERPAFHITPTAGWMNDPNGFSPYHGEYHLFYQYYPYSTSWNDMHWGHVKTQDFITWQRLPAALAPDTDYDQAGCFSGSAIQLLDGRQLLLYTGVAPASPQQNVQAQCAAIGNGVDYEKLSGNPVISHDHLPQGCSKYDFRDPKIWQEPDGTYRAVAAAFTQQDSGAVLLFQSPDAIHWEYACTLDASHNEAGGMWECPDFFPLDGKQVLMVSPMDMYPDGPGIHPGNNAVVLLGSWNPETMEFSRESLQAIDCGLDFYAPQTLQASDGRRIMIGWMQSWQSADAKPQGFPWFGQMTLPRELSLRQGRLFQCPVRELENYRGPAVVHKNVSVTVSTALPEIQGRVIDMTLTLRPGQDCRWFRLYLAEGDGFATTLLWRPEEGSMEIDRTASGLPRDIANIRRFPVQAQDGLLKLRLILDRFSLELFVNDGQQAASAVLYTPQSAQGIRFEARGEMTMDVEKYGLIFPEEEKE